MIYVFHDETLERKGGKTLLVNSCVAAYQERYDSAFGEVEQIRRKRKTDDLAALRAILETIQGLAVVCGAIVDSTLLSAGRLDGTPDISRMARTDNVWSQAMIYAVVMSVRRLLETGYSFSKVDVYYDRKDLRSEHRTAVAKTVKGFCVDLSHGIVRLKALNSGRKVVARRIQSVDKPRKGEAPTKVQVGIWLADRLCASVRKITPGAAPRIEMYDNSAAVNEAIQLWASSDRVTAHGAT